MMGFSVLHGAIAAATSHVVPETVVLSSADTNTHIKVAIILAKCLISQVHRFTRFRLSSFFALLCAPTQRQQIVQSFVDMGLVRILASSD